MSIALQIILSIIVLSGLAFSFYVCCKEPIKTPESKTEELKWTKMRLIADIIDFVAGLLVLFSLLPFGFLQIILPVTIFEHLNVYLLIWAIFTVIDVLKLVNTIKKAKKRGLFTKEKTSA